MRLGELEGIVDDDGGHTADSDAAILLDGRNNSERRHQHNMSELRGGQNVPAGGPAVVGNPTAPPRDELADCDSARGNGALVMRRFARPGCEAPRQRPPGAVSGSLPG
jgi:hypothetical protein